MQALSLSACGPAARTPPRCRATELTLLDVARELGLAHRSRRTTIAKVRLLAGQSGFPLPKNPRFVLGVRQTGKDSIDAFSIWDRDQVLIWLDNDRPPPEAAARAADRQLTVRAEMGKRAFELVASR